MDELPGNVLLNVLMNLELLDLVRSTRVCQRWRDLCQLAVERGVRELDLSRQRYWRLNADALDSILSLCWENLKKITLPNLKKLSNEGSGTKPNRCDPYVKMTVSRWCHTLSKYRFQKLRHLDLGDAATDKNCVETILAFNSKLEILRWATPDPNGVEFGADQRWTASALREVDLGCLFATDALFATLAKNCPNLERFTANSYFRQWTAAGLDKFCGACPRLTTLNLKVSSSLKETGMYVVPLLFDPPNLVMDLKNFWSLSHLRFLSLPFEGGLFDDETLYKISICFPNLETLSFGDSRLSNEGFLSLCRLKKLKSLTMAQMTGRFDDGICYLSSQGRLKKLNLSLTHVDFSTLLSIVQNCPQLQLLNISRSVSNYQIHRGINVTVPEALRLVEFYSHLFQTETHRDTLTLVHCDPGVWTSTSIRLALERQSTKAIRVVSLVDYYKMDEDEDEWE